VCDRVSIVWVQGRAMVQYFKKVQMGWLGKEQLGRRWVLRHHESRPDSVTPVCFPVNALTITITWPVRVDLARGEKSTLICVGQAVIERRKWLEHGHGIPHPSTPGVYGLRLPFLQLS
jgi:hypothetical protein